MESGTTGTIVEIEMLTDSNDVAMLISEFEAIARELGWQPHAQLRNYSDRAVHWRTSVEARSVGGLQLVPASLDTVLPCIQVWPELAGQYSMSVAEVTILALKREYRGKYQLLWPLCIAMWQYCEKSGIEELWLEVTPATRSVYERLGWPLKIIGELRLHWGEPCNLCSMGISEVAASMAIKAKASSTCRAIIAKAFNKN